MEEYSIVLHLTDDTLLGRIHSPSKCIRTARSIPLFLLYTFDPPVCCPLLSTFQDIPNCCIGYAQYLCNSSDWFSLFSELPNGLLSSHRQVTGLLCLLNSEFILTGETQIPKTSTIEYFSNQSKRQLETPTSHAFQYFCTCKWVASNKMC